MDRQSFEKLFKDNYSKAYYLALRILHDDGQARMLYSMLSNWFGKESGIKMLIIFLPIC